MGKVLTVMKVFPDEGVTLEQLLTKVRMVDGCIKAEIAEYVFGAKIIQASFVCEDAVPRDFEEEVGNIPGVSNCQVDEVGLV